MSEKSANNILRLPQTILFGGTFDPPHIGHRAIIESLNKQFQNAEILVIPSGEPVTAGQIVKGTLTPFADRLAMAFLAFEALPAVEISAIESELPPPSYTIQTIRYVLEKTAFKNLAIAIGEDQLDHFDEWKSPREILQLADLIVFPRQSLDLDSVIAKAENLALKYGREATRDGALNRIVTWSGHSIFVMKDHPCHVQSRDLRHQIRSSSDQAVLFIEPQVYEYIHDANLYQESINL
jgi:nicotinate-nucleotide adenylyltransferase